jgi:predicted PurR-regulated permease PerM
MTSSRPSNAPAAAVPAETDGAASAGGGTAAAGAGAAPKPLALRHYLWIAGFVLVVVAALHWLGAVLTPFLVGAILAFLGNPIVDALHRRRVPRALGTLVVILLFGIAIAVLFLVLIPLVQAEIALVARRLPDLVSQFVDRVVPWVGEHLGMRIALDLETLKSVFAGDVADMRELGMRLLAGVKTGGLLLLSLLVNLALIPVVMFYMLRDWHMILARVDELVPRRWRSLVRKLAHEIHLVLAEFLHGQLLVMLVLAAYYGLGLWLAGLDKAFAIGVLTGLLVFIPYVGYGLGLTLGITAALLQWNGLPGFLAVCAVYAAGQLLENYVLIPYLVGDRIGLHPLAVIFALLAFGALFGFAGVLLALPLSAVLLVGLRHLRAEYSESLLYRDQ